MIEDQSKALGILVQAVSLAVKAGVFDIVETNLIIDSIKFFNPDFFKQQEQPVENISDIQTEAKEESATVINKREYNL